MEKVQILKSATVSHEVDPQKGFTKICPNELPVPDGHSIVKELNRQALIGDFRTVSKDVHPSNAIWIADEEHPQFSSLNIENENNVDVAWNKHCMSGTIGSELLDGLPPIIDYDFVVYKGVEPNLHPYGGVYHDLGKTLSTGLNEFFYTNNIYYVILGGLALDYCVKETAIDLVDLGYYVIINLSATRSIGDNKPVIKELENLGVVFINSVDDIEYLNL